MILLMTSLIVFGAERGIFSQENLKNIELKTTAQREAAAQEIEDNKAKVEAAIELYSQKSDNATENIHLEHEDIETEVEGVSNSTLGMQKIFHINMPNRYDREDLITLQTILSGIRSELVPGVSIVEIDEKGLPPMLGQGTELTSGAIACYRSHANVWRKMIHEDIQSAVILEGDATWDVNLRYSAYHLSHALETIMKQQGFLLPGEHSTKQDPLMSKHWDVLQLGGCYSLPVRTNLHIQYYDKYAPPNLEFYGEKVRADHRVIRFRGEEVCTVAYAISKRGAMKLLLRTAVDMDDPVDLVIQRMIRDGQLISYSVWPVLFNQWTYLPTLGIDYKNSEIRGPTEPDTTLGPSTSRWSVIRASMNVWRLRFPHDSKFTNGILKNMRKLIFDKQLVGGKSDEPQEAENSSQRLG